MQNIYRKADFLAELKRRMSKNELPGLTDRLAALVEQGGDVSGGDERSLNEMASAAMSDFALTQRILRLANSPMYACFGGEVATLTRAIAILGTQTVWHLAVGIKLADTLAASAAPVATAAKSLAKATVSCAIARNVLQQTRITGYEELAIGVLLFNAGEVVVSAYFPELANAIAEAPPMEFPESAFLGMTYAELGVELARIWRLPQKLTAALEPLQPEALTPSEPLNHVQWARLLATATTALAAANLEGQPADDVLSRFAEPLAVSAEVMEAAVKLASEDELIQEIVERIDTVSEKKAPPSPAELMAALESDLKAASEAGMSWTVQLNMLMETCYHALALDEALVLLLSTSETDYVARLGIGKRSPKAVGKLMFAKNFSPDVVHVALTMDKPIYLPRIGEARVPGNVPTWLHHYYPKIAELVLIPLQTDYKTCAVLVGLRETSGKPLLSEGTQAQLNQIRAMLCQGKRAAEDTSTTPAATQKMDRKPMLRGVSALRPGSLSR